MFVAFYPAFILSLVSFGSFADIDCHIAGMEVCLPLSEMGVIVAIVGWG